MCVVCCRWQNIQVALDAHRKRLDIALEIHAFNRDVDDINDRINEKVGISWNNLI
jgi:spectrin beta